MTWVLIALNVAAFGVELAMGLDPMAPKAQDVLRAGADFGPYTLHGEWWRVVTSMFLHFGLIHIGMNMLVLAQGRIVEIAYGHLGFAVIYLVSGILGAVGSLAHAPSVVSAGASGAVFGVFGAFGALLLLRRDRIDPAVWQRAARGLGTFIVLNLVIGYESKGIDLTAHIVGMIAGFAIGAAQLLGKPTPKQYVPRALAALIAGLAIAVAVLVALPVPAISQLDDAIAHAGQVEKELLARFDLEQQATTPEATRFADVIEREILPAWQPEIARLEAFEHRDLPERARHHVELLVKYMNDRRLFWETYARFLRTGADDQMKQAEQLDQQLRDDVTLLNADLK